MNESTYDMEDTIILTIEKLSRAWRYLLWDWGKKYGLTPLQIQVIAYLSPGSGKTSCITEIAKEFDLSKPTVTETIHSLEKKKLVSRIISPRDRRGYAIFLSPAGKKMVEKLSSWKIRVKERIEKISYEKKENALIFLMELIVSLKESGIIQEGRTCINCGNFIQDAYPGSLLSHFCKFQDRPVSNSQLRINCERYTEKIVLVH